LTSYNKYACQVAIISGRRRVAAGIDHKGQPLKPPETWPKTVIKRRYIMYIL
jgi:hypothetical protein